MLGTITVPPVEIVPRVLDANASERLEVHAEAWGAQRLLKIVRDDARRADCTEGASRASSARGGARSP